MKTLFVALLSTLFLFSQHINASQGGQMQVFGDYEIHYMGLTTEFLKPDVAAAYNITRSRSMGYLSISILKRDSEGGMATSMTGQVKGQIRNLLGQSRTLSFEEVMQGDSVYYLSTFRFDDKDMYNIRLQVSPSDISRSFDVNFSQRFYQ